MRSSTIAGLDRKRVASVYSYEFLSSCQSNILPIYSENEGTAEVETLETFERLKDPPAESKRGDRDDRSSSRWITDLAMLQIGDVGLVISTSRTGLVQIWR